ncbi:MAG: hypothetical protein V4482_00580 [Pseudomonadota bacterium]
MSIRLIMIVLGCVFFSAPMFSSTLDIDHAEAFEAVHGRLATYILNSPAVLSGTSDLKTACKADADVAMSVYQAALAMLNDSSGIINEARSEKESRIRSHECRIKQLSVESERAQGSVQHWREILPILDNAHLGRIVGKSSGGIDFGNKLCVPKLSFKLALHVVLEGENDRNWDRFHYCDQYESFSLTREEYVESARDINAFYEAFKASRKADYALHLSAEERKIAELSAELSDLRSRKSEIMRQIQEDVNAYIRSRSAINLRQISEIKLAFQVYGNALNSGRGDVMGAKERINGLLPTLDHRNAIWLAEFLPPSEFTVVEKKK